MAEYIDKGRLIMSMNDWMLQNAPVKAGDDTTRADTILDAIKMVMDSPTVDAVEVARCRECKHNLCPDKPNSVCGLDMPIFDICGYCSEGERREDAGSDGTIS